VALCLSLAGYVPAVLNTTTIIITKMFMLCCWPGIWRLCFAVWCHTRCHEVQGVSNVALSLPGCLSAGFVCCIAAFLWCSRMGDWERKPLTPEQQRYAAMDAWACLLLHWELQQLPTRQTLSQQMIEAMRQRAAAETDT